MRHWSCEFLFENKNKFKQKIDILSNRMIDLQKDIDEIQMKNNSSTSSQKIQKTNKNIDKIKEDKITYISKNNKSNYNLNYNRNKNIYLNHNNSKTNINKNNSCSTLSNKKLEYVYELRILKRKLNELKEKNKKLKDNINIMKEKNNKIESNLNLYINLFDDNIKENKDYILLKEIKDINSKKIIIKKLIEICKINNKLHYNSHEDIKNEEEYKLNIIINLMDIRFFYENSLLFNYFFQGLKQLLPNINKENIYFNNDIKNDILNYINELLREESSIKKMNENYKNSKKYYDLCKKFSNLKNMENFLNNIILKNIKVEESINQIKNVLKEERTIKENNYNGNYDLKKKDIIEQFLNRNNPKYNLDRFSFYTTNYYNNKITHYNYNNFNKNNISKNNKNEKQNKSFSSIKQKKIINTNYNNYIQSKKKKCMNEITKSNLKMINNKKPTNFNKLYSFSFTNNSNKGNLNFNS